MRIVLDTNVIVSNTLTPYGPTRTIFQHWLQKTFNLVVSETILTEYSEALCRPEIQKRHNHSDQEIAKSIELFRKSAIVVTSTTPLTIVKDDPDDNVFIEAAVAGRAEYIVSKDPDLLTLKEYQGIQMITPGQFYKILQDVRPQ